MDLLADARLKNITHLFSSGKVLSFETAFLTPAPDGICPGELTDRCVMIQDRCLCIDTSIKMCQVSEEAGQSATRATSGIRTHNAWDSVRVASNSSVSATLRDIPLVPVRRGHSSGGRMRNQGTTWSILGRHIPRYLTGGLSEMRITTFQMRPTSYYETSKSIGQVERSTGAGARLARRRMKANNQI